MTVAILVPVLDRPGRALPLAASLRATTDSLLVFLVTRGDSAERQAIHRVQDTYPNVEEVVVPFPLGPADYQRKINYGVDVTTSEWVFQGADDLAFHPGWLDEALDVAARSGMPVIGTNDLCNPRSMSGRHSTHTLVSRAYVEEHGTFDEPGKLLHEGYFHSFCDDELVHTAKARGMFVAARESHVEHLHPQCGGTARDSTYERALDAGHFAADRDLFRVRQALIYGKRPVAGRRAR